MPRTETPTPKLFRGENLHCWERRLKQQGWPEAAAVKMAKFLTQQAPVSDLEWWALVGQRVAEIDHSQHGAK